MAEGISPTDSIILSVVLSVVLSGLVGFIVAMIVKYKFKPHIEVIFEQTRSELISSMFVSINQVHERMKNVFEILERQNRFVPDHAITLNFNQNDANLIQFHHQTINSIFESFRNFTDYRYHLTNEEFLTLENYVHFTNLFMNDLDRRPFAQYAPELLSSRRDFAFEIIRLFPKHISNDFKTLWNATLNG